MHELRCLGTAGRSCSRGWEGSAPGRPRRVLLAYSSSSRSDPESSVLLDVRATGVSGAGLRLTPEGCSGEEMRKRSKVSALPLPWRGRSANTAWGLGPCAAVLESESDVAQSCPSLSDSMGCSPPGSFVHGILQARVLEWVAISFARESSQPRDGTRVSRIVGRRFII